MLSLNILQELLSKFHGQLKDLQYLPEIEILKIKEQKLWSKKGKNCFSNDKYYNYKLFYINSLNDNYFI